jgi:hypothetical protein
MGPITCVNHGNAHQSWTSGRSGAAHGSEPQRVRTRLVQTKLTTQHEHAVFCHTRRAQMAKATKPKKTRNPYTKSVKTMAKQATARRRSKKK